MEPGKPVSNRRCAIYTRKSSETLCFFDRGELGKHGCRVEVRDRKALAEQVFLVLERFVLAP
jgi:hypothetical protein